MKDLRVELQLKSTEWISTKEEKRLICEGKLYTSILSPSLCLHTTKPSYVDMWTLKSKQASSEVQPAWGANRKELWPYEAAAKKIPS